MRRGGRRSKKTFGFTLVEVVITTSIIALVTAASLASMSSFKPRRDVEGNARTVAAAIRQAQNDAVTGKNIDACGTVLCVPFHSDQVALTGGVSLTSSSEVAFRVPQGEPVGSGGAEIVSGAVDISVSKAGVTAHVCVYPLGRVEERPIGSGC
ncbi:MAG: prepilin-type N-terminal cleavage/methylation domain-containing protein [Candidatus Moranbacteria bacterium]|nr:prepilin-type N-terminal cleavage/methylation domain-containing protein [Candidatus Moranbacteria bacterium]